LAPWFDRTRGRSRRRIEETVTAEPHMFEKFKSAALHGLIGLAALAIVPLSCMLVLALTDEKQVVHQCPATVCQGPLVSEYRDAAAKPQIASYLAARQ
jgi:ABC-type glycerol-3-phosphate transport system permease component